MKNVTKKNKVSFSQYSTFLKCPHKWYLDYPKNLRKFEGSINMAFGTAIHETFQKYLETLYTVGAKEADSLDCNEIFKDAYDREVELLLKDGIDIDNDTYKEFYYNGEDILLTFLKLSNRLKHFPNKYELVGIEIPLEIDILRNVVFIGFIDIVLKEKGKEKYLIIDFKTSNSGWNVYMKSDITKVAQLQLYKAMYSKKLNIPLHAIDVQFFIVKRNLYENVSFPQSRIQVFVPPHGPKIIGESLSYFREFIEYAFNEDGTYNLDNEYLKYPGKNKKHCKYCKYYKNICDGKESK